MAIITKTSGYNYSYRHLAGLPIQPSHWEDGPPWLASATTEDLKPGATPSSLQIKNCIDRKKEKHDIGSNISWERLQNLKQST